MDYWTGLLATDPRSPWSLISWTCSKEYQCHRHLMTMRWKGLYHSYGHPPLPPLRTPCLIQIFNRLLELINTFLLQVLPHHPFLHHRTTWLQTCHSDICGHEVLWTSSESRIQGHCWTPCSLFTRKWGRWMMHSTWDSITPCNTLTWSS